MPHTAGVLWLPAERRGRVSRQCAAVRAAIEDMDTGLAGKVALITGGAGVIGRACARALAGEGAAVAVADLGQGAVEAAAAEVRTLGVPALGLTLDITGEAEVAAMIRRVVADLGRLDV